MPAKGKSKISDAQRRKIAAAKVAGKSHRTIAAETGLALTTVDHAATDPRTVTLILHLKAKKEPQIERMFTLALDTMERDMNSKDASVRSAARAQFLRLLPLGDPPLLRVAANDGSAGDFTLEELLVTLRKASG